MRLSRATIKLSARNDPFHQSNPHSLEKIAPVWGNRQDRNEPSPSLATFVMLFGRASPHGLMRFSSWLRPGSRVVIAGFSS
jgi:hypothetical protein